MNARPNLTVVTDDDPLRSAGHEVTNFHRHYVNDRNNTRHELHKQFAGMLMDSIRSLWQSGSWRHYRNTLGEFEWHEHEFDYFLAAQMMNPIEVAQIIRGGSVHDWADLINSTNPGHPGRSNTRRPIAAAADDIRRSVPGGHGDPDTWVRHAAAGFGDRNDQQIAKSKKKLAQAEKSSLSAIKEGEQVFVRARAKRDPAKSEAQQQAELILGWLSKNPQVDSLVRKALH